MEVILLERVAKLGQMGDVVKVKDGFARNFLLKRNKALRATKENREKYDGMKAELEAKNIQAKGEATKVAEKIDGRNVVIIRQASETGQLYGSVSVRDIMAALEADGVALNRSQVLLDAPIKTIGQHKITIAVHPEVEVHVSTTVARSEAEAERINRGEDVNSRQEDRDAAAEAIAAADLFGAAHPKQQRGDQERHHAVQKEDGPPTDEARQDAAQRETEQLRDGARGEQHRDGARPIPVLERIADVGQPHREGGGRHGASQEAHHHQRLERADDPTQGCTDGECQQRAPGHR